MSLNTHHDSMTAAQQREIMRLCQEAVMPDKSGELLTRPGAAQLIDELDRKAREPRS